MQAQKQSDGILQLVGFTVDEEKFAVDISGVHEINRFEQINKIPDLPDYILGVIDLRGIMMPVVNLAAKLGLKSHDVTKDTRIIITEFNGEKTGVLVDAVSEVLRIAANSLEKPSSMIQSISSEYISGIIRNNNELIIVLDPPKLFKDYNMPLSTGIPENIENKCTVTQYMNDNDTIREIAEAAKAMYEGDFNHEIKEELYGRIGEIAKYINDTVKKLQSVEPSIAEASDATPQASMQLSEITKATEEATHGVMSQVELVLDSQDLILHYTSAIEKERDTIKPVEDIRQIVVENKETLLDIITGLSFQDLTGQKIKSVVSLIEEVEKRLLQLIVTFGLKSKENALQSEPLKEFPDNPTREQDLVDSILSKFGFE